MMVLILFWRISNVQASVLNSSISSNTSGAIKACKVCLSSDYMELYGSWLSMELRNDVFAPMP